ncbi:hypothetical protein CNMCM6936_005542 [Aspergillus lentulus]|uniref:Uncharacterized protein n=1 Tax=Aspergillus lentulus TaxID=293939 RepID=A0AAN6BN57_ASPLE|nr:hypothetical protein CNMCM6069_008586 [Aspergillus lentulus]KAF4167152.1 hypothetical protein CNMCM6936_005542 [Aspergillus lentulus]KAF4174725.1 hypothetical protein CNMCM8060_008288 [Aspergillus lentulus]KAF4183795.1 hypothetical protein CNMCM7927_008753 [Aspergillus lentulus]KAF4193824.1 hypothetical protein CNMCM8694_008419 [Aspergillus lentulus]
MTQNKSHKSPKGAIRDSRALNITKHLDPKSASSSSRRSSKSLPLSSFTTDHKRRASSSSISSVSSVSSIEALSDDANESEEDADDEKEQPAVCGPSYGRRDKGRKSGMKSTARKRVRLSVDDGYDGQRSSDESDSYESSDDVYAAVDDISDGDDEDQDVEILEELLIVESEDEHDVDDVFKTSTVSELDLAGTNTFEDHMLLSAASFFDEDQLYSAMETFGETDFASEAAAETPMPRRVHFEEDSDSSSDSDSHTEDEIPSDFLQQDSLDPQLRRMIENDNENYSSRRRQSDELFAESDYGHSNIYHVESDAVSEGSESSGYETDDGETTDEDLPPPATITHPRSILRRDSSASLPPADENKSQPPTRRRGPILGTFVADPHKPVALVDCTGKHLVIIPAYASSRHDWLESATNSICGTANNSPRATTMHLIDESDTDALASPNRHDLSPMLASSANLMMTALGNDIAPGGQVMGPPEAFYPSRDFAIDSSFEDDDDDDDPEAALNVEDFIDFGDGDGSSDEEMGKASDEDAIVSPMATASMTVVSGTPTPNRGGDVQQTNSAERFLNHLDRGIVTAFRRNHNRYQALLRLPQHREFMPANSPSRPASVFRHARHADQRTPTRKRKASGYAGGEAVRRKLMDAHRRTQIPF